jgi:hypothetical protein
MNAPEILALIQSARALLDLGVSQYRLAEQEGRLTEQQKANILAAAQLTDDQVDDVIEAARQRLAPVSTSIVSN